MVRKLRGAIFFFGLVTALQVNALGLGDLTLKTSLNEPLVAEISLLNVKDLDVSQILVKLASPRDFERSGVERQFFLTNLLFEVKIDNQGNGKIVVTTKKSVNEPYLDFVIEARWPAGKLLREYTVLLDLPIYTEERQSVVNLASAADSEMKQVQQAIDDGSTSMPGAASPKTVESMPEPKPKPAKIKEKAAAPKAQPKAKKPASSYQGQTYRVKRGDVLWTIARKLRPSDNVSVQQTIVAIQQINPDAFINDNINLIKTGQVLRVPDESQVMQTTARQAIRAISAQNRAWKEGVTAPTLEASRREIVKEKPVEAAAESRLRLAASAPSKDAQNDGGGDAESGQLKAQLAASKESLDKVSRENEDVKAKMGEMEAQLETLQRMVQLKDDQLAAMQQDMAKATESASAQTEAALAEAAAAKAAAESEASKARLAAESAKEAKEAAKKVAKPDPAKVVKPRTPVKEKSVLDTILGNPVYLVIAGLVLAIIGFLVVRRKRDTEDETQGFTQPAEQELYVETQEDAQEPAFEESDYAEEPAEEIEEPAEEVTASAQLETGDAIGEADIYVAYGRYQHAIELLQTAIDREPQRSDLRVKMLEVYVEADDRAGFDAQFEQLQSLGDEGAVNQVKEMLSSAESSASWLDAQPQAQDDLDTFADAEGDSDFDTDSLESDLGDDAFDTDLGAELEIDLEDSVESFDAALNEEVEAELSDVSFDLEVDSDLGEDVLESSGELRDLGESLDDDELDLDLGADFEQHVAGTDTPSDEALPDDEAVDDSTQMMAAVQPKSSEDDFDFVSVADEVATKLDLARAYIDMGDIDGAKDILDEVSQEGDEDQKVEASELLSRIT